MFDRLVNFHKLNNLLWVYGANVVSPPNVDPYETYYPGNDVVDILATDIYHSNFAKEQYDLFMQLVIGLILAYALNIDIKQRLVRRLGGKGMICT